MIEIILISIFVALVALILLVIRPARLKRCRHQFKTNAWVDLNEDPRCVHCGKWLQQIIKEGSIDVTQDPDKEHYTAIHKK